MEFAVCLPVLLTVVLGIIEFGRGMMVGELLYNGSRVGARQGIIPNTTNATVTQSVASFMQAAGVDSQYVTTTITVTPALGNPDPGNQLNAAKTGDVCTIRVQVPFAQVSYIPGNYLNGKTLSGTCTMLHE